MKLIFWVVVGFAVTGLAFWAMVTPGLGQNPVLLALIVGVFVAPPLGAFWMLYMSVRYEKKPLPLIFLALLPYTFLWYYFERVRHGRHVHGGQLT